jgi:hypothetical protein
MMREGPVWCNATLGGWRSVRSPPAAEQYHRGGSCDHETQENRQEVGDGRGVGVRPLIRPRIGKRGGHDVAEHRVRAAGQRDDECDPREGAAATAMYQDSTGRELCNC